MKRLRSGHFRFLLSGLLATFLLLTMLPVGASAAAGYDVYPTESIQAAVDRAKPGDVITVHAGVYEQAVTFKYTHNGITLKGEEGTVLDGTNLTSEYPDDVYAMILIGDGVSNIVIEDFEIRNFVGAAIVIGAAHGNTVKNNTMSSCQYGVENGGDNNQITGNEITNMREDGIWLGNAKSNTIVGNKISGCGITDIPDVYNGIYLGTSSNNLIRQNVVSGATGAGIFLGWASNNNVISLNIIRHSGTKGVLLHEGSDNNEVTNNSISGSGSDGIMLQGFCSKNLLEANQISYSGARGIVTVESSGDTIRNNLVWNSDNYGILLVNSSKVSIVSNLVAASGAGMDMVWNGVGSSIKWKDNIGTIGQVP